MFALGREDEKFRDVQRGRTYSSNRHGSVSRPLVSGATVTTLSWYATVGGIRTVQEYEMFRRRHEHETLFMQRIISTTMSYKAKRDETQLRIVTHEYADAMCVPEREHPTHTSGISDQEK